MDVFKVLIIRYMKHREYRTIGKTLGDFSNLFS